MSDPIHVISLGAGVQSSTMALMAAKGEITPMPVAAIFADVGAEPKNVYAYLDFLESQLPFPVYRVNNGSLRDTITTIRHKKDGTGSYVKQQIPAYVESSTGRGAPLMRGCTRDYKVLPIVRKVRALIAEHGAESAVQWIGISRDEAQRMKDSGLSYIQHRWPLIDLRMTRENCLEWMARNGYPRPPRSACTFCPFHSDMEWHRLKTEDPESFADAVATEKLMQEAMALATADAVRGMRPYLHQSLKPLDTIDFRPDDSQLNLFGNECEGMCGV